jgi:hypothetical protein
MPCRACPSAWGRSKKPTPVIVAEPVRFWKAVCGCPHALMNAFRAARRWLARLLEESPALTLDEVDVGLGCLRGVAALYEDPSREVLRALVKRRQGTRGS